MTNEMKMTNDQTESFHSPTYFFEIKMEYFALYAWKGNQRHRDILAVCRIGFIRCGHIQPHIRNIIIYISLPARPFWRKAGPDSWQAATITFPDAENMTWASSRRTVPPAHPWSWAYTRASASEYTWANLTNLKKKRTSLSEWAFGYSQITNPNITYILYSCMDFAAITANWK